LFSSIILQQNNKSAMKKMQYIQDLTEQTEKQHLILRLRLAMEVNRTDIIESLTEKYVLLSKI
jgi:hypothetical protein